MPTTDMPEGGTAITTDRAINTTAPLSGGGDLSADRTISLDNLGVSTAKLADAAVTLAKMAALAALTIIGSVAGGTPAALTATQVTAMLNAFSSTLKGLVPASGGGTANFLRADGTWAAPPGGTSDTYDLIDVKDDHSAAADETTDDHVAIRAAIAAAAAAVTSTGRYQVVYFQGGGYASGNRISGVDFRHYDINNLSKIILTGPANGRRARLLQNGSAGSADWYLIDIRGGSSNIEIRNLDLDQAGMTSPDAAEQNHLLQIGTSCSNVTVVNCAFRNTVGDGIRFLGDWGVPVQYVKIHNCVFYECGRSGISVQRWCRDLEILNCEFEGGDDQMLDFEPTSYAKTAAAGSDADTIVGSGTNFTTYDLVVGDQVYDTEEKLTAKVTVVTDATHIETSAAVVSWNGDSYSFPRSQGGALISGNRFKRGSNTNAILVTLSDASGVQFIGNKVEGQIFGQYLKDSLIAHNTVDDRTAAGAGNFLMKWIKGCRGVTVAHNHLYIRNTTTTDSTGGIIFSQQDGVGADGVLIEGNTVFCGARCTAIGVSGVKRALIQGNRCILNTPGDTTHSIGIAAYSASGLTADSIVIEGNDISAEQGSWLTAYDCDAVTANVTAISISGGSWHGCTNAIIFRETTGGVYANPPVVGPSLSATGSITPPISVPWIKIGGVGGAAALTSSKLPGIFWGSGSPESVLAGAIGNVAYRYDGAAGTQTYFKTSGTGTTGWVPTGGVVATGSITCATKANLADTDYCTVSDGINPAVLYEFDTAGDGVTSGRVQVNVSTDTTATEVAARLLTAINANQPSLTVANGSGTLTLTHKIPGTFANVTITENVAHASFTVTGMTGGVNPP